MQSAGLGEKRVSQEVGGKECGEAGGLCFFLPAVKNASERARRQQKVWVFASDRTCGSPRALHSMWKTNQNKHPPHTREMKCNRVQDQHQNQEPKNLIKTQEGKRMPPKTSRKYWK